MSQSFYTAISGLRAQQQKLDVTANNLANSNTTGFKSQAVTFNDLMYHTVRSGSSTTNASAGGTNPIQVGTGVEVSRVSRRFAQGALESTGESLDFAIQGDGYFTVANQDGRQLYSRSGSFGVDNQGFLVDPATGFQVQRTGPLGNSTREDFGFQTTGDLRIRVPIGASIPGNETSELAFNGNFPADATPPIAEILRTSSPFETATGPATTTTLFDDLSSNVTNYQAGDLLEIRGTNTDGSPFALDFSPTNSTLGDLIDALNVELTGSTASLDSQGSLEIRADNTGQAFSTLVIRDATANTGATDFENHSLDVDVEGKEGDIYETSLSIYDERGQGHVMQFAFQKQSPNHWDLTVSHEDSNTVFSDNQVLDLYFNEDGTFQSVGATGDGDTDISFQLEGFQTINTIDIAFDQLTHLSTQFTLNNQQDGFPPGNLVDINTSAEGQLIGVGSNGVDIPLAQLAIASFQNDGGLESVGQNYFSETLDSGQASIGSGLENGRGRVFGSQLEGSNVDITQEFTQLIIAQRGFSANARTITVADEVLEEAINILR